MGQELSSDFNKRQPCGQLWGFESDFDFDSPFLRNTVMIPTYNLGDFVTIIGS